MRFVTFTSINICFFFLNINITYSFLCLPDPSPKNEYEVVVQQGHIRGVASENLTVFGGGIATVSLSPDGSRAISAADDAQLILWDVDNGMQLRSISITNHQVPQLAVLSRDGEKVWGTGNENSVSLWSSQSGEKLQSIKTYDVGINSISGVQRVFLDHDSRFGACSWYNEIAVWNLMSGKRCATVSADREKNGMRDLELVCLSPDGRHFVCRFKRQQRYFQSIWRSETGKELYQFATDAVCAAISPDGQFLYTPKDDGDKEVISERRLESGIEVRSFGPRGLFQQIIVSGNQGEILTGETNVIRVINVQTGDIVHQFEDKFARVHSMAFGNRGPRAVVADFSGKFRVLDIAAEKSLLAISTNGNSQNVVAVSETAEAIAVGDASGKIRIWGMNNSSRNNTLSSHRNTVLSLSFSGDGKLLLSSSADGSSILWDVAMSSVIHRIHEKPVRRVVCSLSADGEKAAYYDFLGRYAEIRI